MFALWSNPIIFSCKYLIQHHSHSGKKFLLYACVVLLYLFLTYNIYNFASQLYFILKTSLLCYFLFFNNVSCTSVQFYIVVYNGMISYHTLCIRIFSIFGSYEFSFSHVSGVLDKGGDSKTKRIIL